MFSKIRTLIYLTAIIVTTRAENIQSDDKPEKWQIVSSTVTFSTSSSEPRLQNTRQDFSHSTEESDKRLELKVQSFPESEDGQHGELQSSFRQRKASELANVEGNGHDNFGEESNTFQSIITARAPDSTRDSKTEQPQQISDLKDFSTTSPFTKDTNQQYRILEQRKRNPILIDQNKASQTIINGHQRRPVDGPVIKGKHEIQSHEKTEITLPGHDRLTTHQFQQIPGGSNRAPVFDFARFSTTTTSPKIESKSRQGNKERIRPLQRPNFSKSQNRERAGSSYSSPIIFNLGARGRHHRFLQNKNTRAQGVQSQEKVRSRHIVRVRPKSLQQQLSQSKSRGDLPEGEHSTPTDQVNKVTTLRTPLTSSTIRPRLRTIGNVTLSLERARELFARAKERYKSSSMPTSSSPQLNSTKPRRPSSYSYTKIRHTDGSISHIEIPSKSESLQFTTAVPIKITASVTPTTNDKISHIEIPTEIERLQVTTAAPLEITTSVSPTIIEYETTEDLDLINPKTKDYQETTQYIAIPEYETTIDYQAINSDLVTTPPTFSTESYDEESTTIKPEELEPKLNVDITKAESIPKDIGNVKNFPKTNIPPPVYPNSPFALQRQPSLQNFNPFGISSSNNQKQTSTGFGQSPGSVSSQSPNFSNLFGLGSLPSLGGLSKSLGSLGSFDFSQGFGTVGSEASQIGQPSGSGTGGGNYGYLSLLSGLSGIGQPSGSSSSDFSLPSLGQGSSGQPGSTGLGFLSGLPSLNLGSLGNLGSLSNLGSLPTLGNLGSSAGSSGSGFPSLSNLNLGIPENSGSSSLGSSGLSSLAVPGSSLSGLSPDITNVESILGKLTNPGGLAPQISQPSLTLGKTSAIGSSGVNLAASLGAVNPPSTLNLGDAKISSSSLNVDSGVIS